MDPFIGEVRLVGFQYAPQGWSFCDGSVLQISAYQVVFSLMGTTYGGDGVSTFALPKLDAGALQPGLKYIIALEGVYPSRP